MSCVLDSADGGLPCRSGRDTAKSCLFRLSFFDVRTLRFVFLWIDAAFAADFLVFRCGGLYREALEEPNHLQDMVADISTA